MFRKSRKAPFQIINLDETYISAGKDNQLEIIKIEDNQKTEECTIYFKDFNFDGLEDLAVSDGRNGGYSAASYKIYLYSPRRKRFVFNRKLTKLTQSPYLGIFIVDPKNKTLQTFWKSGCCFHETQKFKVIKNSPVKIFEYSDDAMIGDGNRYITTRKLINGKWRTWKKIVKE